MLAPLASLLEREDVHSKSQTILHVLQKPALPTGKGVTQKLILLARLRNELVHYKSRWNAHATEAKFVRGLKAQKFEIPPFRRDAAVYFPLQVLGASCADWCVQTSYEFLQGFYECLGVQPPLRNFKPVSRR